MKTKSLLALLLALVMMLSACGVPSDNTDDTGDTGDTANSGGAADSGDAADTNAETAEPAFDAEKLEIPENEKFSGYTFNVLTHDTETAGYNYGNVDFDEPSDNALDNAMYQRSLAVEGLLGITITQQIAHIFEVYNTFKTSTMAESGDFDITFVKVPNACNAVTDGLAAPIHNFEYINLDKAWWDDNVISQMEVLNTPYMVAGDIALSDKDPTWAFFFNKKVVRDNDLENPYDLVFANEWTWDKMIEMCKAVSAELNGDDVRDENDMWGLTTENETFPAMWMSAGLTLASINEEGYPELNWGTEQFFDVYTKLSEFMNSEYVDWKRGYEGFQAKTFRNNMTLFRSTCVSRIKQLSNWEIEGGVLPMPKYDASQEKYYSMAAGNSSIMIIGNDSQDTYRTGIITEAMAAYGHEIVMPTYYDKQLKSRYASDEVVPQMLDLIFDGRIYDLGMFYDWGVNSLIGENINVSTQWAQNERALNQKVKKLIKAIDGEE